MANYTIPENPQYTAEIRKLENTDPANAETILNPLVETLIGNTHAVKLEADKKANSGHTHSPGNCGLGKNLTFTGAVTGTYNGQAAKSVLIPDRKGCRFVVGTSTNGWTEKDCDYLCDGTDDQVKIKAAINALPATGGEIKLLDGTYNFGASLLLNKSVKIIGEGIGKTIFVRQYTREPNSYDNLISVEYLKSGDCVLIEDVTIDGNKGIYNSNAYHGVFGINLNKSNLSLLFNRIEIRESAGESVRLLSVDKSSIFQVTNCIFRNCYEVIDAHNAYTQNNIFIKNNIFISCGLYGVHSYASSQNYVIDSNIFINTVYPISITGNHNSITNNVILDDDSKLITGILIYGDYNNISVNCVTSTKSSYETLKISGNNNLIADNMIWGKNYTNSGTNNTFVNNKYN